MIDIIFAIIVPIAIGLTYFITKHMDEKHPVCAGNIIIEQRPERKVISLELEVDPDEIENHGIIYFRVLKPQEKQSL